MSEHHPISLKEDGGIFIRLYPETNIRVEVSQQTALHLFSLACRYNDTIGRKSWASFWPRIGQIERSITVMFMEANSSRGIGMLGFDMIHPDAWESTIAKSFRDVASSKRRKTLTNEVEKELVDLYRVYVKARVPVGKVRSIWQQEWPKVFALLQAHNALDPLLENDRCYDTDHIYEVVHNLLLRYGHDIVQVAGEEGAVISHEDWCANDASLFASVIYQHVS